MEVNRRYHTDILGSELIINYDDSGKEIKFNIKYNKSLFNADFIIQIANEFCHLLEYMADKKIVSKSCQRYVY